MSVYWTVSSTLLRAKDILVSLLTTLAFSSLERLWSAAIATLDNNVRERASYIYFTVFFLISFTHPSWSWCITGGANIEYYRDFHNYFMTQYGTFFAGKYATSVRDYCINCWQFEEFKFSLPLPLPCPLQCVAWFWRLSVWWSPGGSWKHTPGWWIWSAGRTTSSGSSTG